MKKILLTSAIAFTFLGIEAQIFLAKESHISFFSEAPLENIEANNTVAKPILNTATNDIQVKIRMDRFLFENSLMQEHFNEDYLETEKYPHCIFKGKINEEIDYSKDGEHKITVTGELDLHGVIKERTLEGTISIKGEQILITTAFNIHIEDHNIKVPKAVIQNIAEDVLIKLTATLEPLKKDEK